MPRGIVSLSMMLAGVFIPCLPIRAQEQYTDPDITADDRAHWSFVPPKRPAIPNWTLTTPPSSNPIDAFVAKRLHEHGLSFSPAADPRTLIRRLSFDLTGLPPSPDLVEAFVADPSPKAYESLVDRFLASPHFGERWAQHWLDVVRFAESNGYEADGERPHAWRYRDYVISSLNQDKPYDQFLREQIAGDILAGERDPRQTAELWAATGLHRCGPVHMVGGNIDPAVLRQEVLTEMVNGLGSAVLGITIGCARCHDHKFDPISLGDYYRLQAFFAGTKFSDVSLATEPERTAFQAQQAQVQALISPLNQKIQQLEAPYRTRLLAEKKAKLDPEARKAVDTPAAQRTEEQKRLAAESEFVLRIYWDEVLAIMSPSDRAERDRLKAEVRRLKTKLPPPLPQAWAVRDLDDQAETHILKRGDIHRKAGSVRPAFPRVMSLAPAQPRHRLDLAEWLTRPDHPLTARVIVNRLWQHHFGHGIVRTANDFGTRGEPPTHPELLDWLAKELVEPTITVPGVANKPWCLKRLHKLMVLSTTYQQTSATPSPKASQSTGTPGVSKNPAPQPQQVDPENKFLWRMNRRRLEAEAIRDSILAVAGTLNPEIGGPSVKVPLEPEVYDLIFTEGEPDDLWPVTPDPQQHQRRSLYLFRKRNVRQPLLEAFDQPDTLNPCADRSESIFAPQALILMNGPLSQAQAKAMARELLKSGESSNTALITSAYRRAFQRLPTTQELALAEKFLQQQSESLLRRLAAREPIGLPENLPSSADPVQARALADLCLALFNTHEFVVIP